jgi:DmsE family decaheme c-type cytochrome
MFLGLALVGVLALAGLATAMPAEGAYAGSEVCAGCHEDKALTGTPHGRPAFGKATSLGCEACHGPAALHAEDPSVEANRPAVATKLAASAASTACLDCHSGGNQAFWKGSTHEARQVSCVTCHSVHGGKTQRALLKAKSEMDTCYECHKDVRADTFKSSHHPIREGKIACADCHNPHGTTTDKMLAAASLNDLCYTCHGQYRGPFVWEHPPVRENCANCHTPHGSNHLYLQKTSIPFNCQQCHLHTRHPGTIYDGFKLPTLENEATGNVRLFNQACLSCHGMIHGTNSISSPYLGH